MNKTFGYYVFGSLLIGALFGSIWTVGSNPLIGAGIGALAGTFIGWFVAAAVLEQNKKKQDK
jgi:ABC-type uncharacterized transport system permease subunit